MNITALHKTTAALLGLLLSSLPLAKNTNAAELEWLCGEYSFLGGAKVYAGKLQNGRPIGLVVFDARSEAGRVLALYAFGPKSDGGGGQGCKPHFGKIHGDTLVVSLGGSTKATYIFEESGKVSLEWSRRNRSGKTEKLEGKLKEQL